MEEEESGGGELEMQKLMECERRFASLKREGKHLQALEQVPPTLGTCCSLEPMQKPPLRSPPLPPLLALPGCSRFILAGSPFPLAPPFAPPRPPPPFKNIPLLGEALAWRILVD